MTQPNALLPTEEQRSEVYRLAEHLYARKKPGDFSEYLDWLAYSLDRCGLAVVPQESAMRALAKPDEGVG